jgi:hypothetical protein
MVHPQIASAGPERRSRSFEILDHVNGVTGCACGFKFAAAFRLRKGFAETRGLNQKPLFLDGN